MLEQLGLGIVLTMEDDFTPQANKAMQSMEMFENQVDVMSKNVSKAMNNLQNLMLAGFSLNTIGGDFIRGGQKILGFYKDMAGEMININSQFDSIGATFKTVYGDLANEKLEWAMDFSVKTPFQVKDTTRAMSGLHAIGLDVTQQVKSATGELVPLLQAMGDLSTRNTGARGGISGMMEAVSNLYGGDGGRSLRARFDLPKTYVDDLKDAVDEGGEVFAQKFSELANKLTPNAMKNMLGTWEQVVAEMEDTWDMFIWKIGKAGAFDTAKQTLKDISGVLGRVASNENAIQAISNTFQAIWKPVDLLAKGLIKATEAITDFVTEHPKLSEFIATGVAMGGAFMVATGALMKMAGSVVVLGASVASLYLNFKLVKGLNLVGEFDFIYKAVTRGAKSISAFGLITGGFLLALKGKYGDLESVGTKVAGKLKSAWKQSDDILENGITTVDQLSSSWNVVNRATMDGVGTLSLMNRHYDSLALKLTRLRLLGTIVGRSLFGDVVDGQLQYTQKELDNINSFGLMPIAQTFAILRGRTDAFVDGVVNGMGVAIDICKSFFDIVSKPFIAFFDAIDVKLKPIGEVFKSIFGIKGTDGMNLTEAEKQIEMFRQLGEATGKLMGTLLAFKAIKTITSFITSPFIALGKHIGNATDKLSGFHSKFMGMFGNKNKITVSNNRNMVSSPTLDQNTQAKLDKQNKYANDYLVPYRTLKNSKVPISNTVPDTQNTNHGLYKSSNGTYTDVRKKQVLPKITAPMYGAYTVPKVVNANDTTSKSPVSNVTSTRVPVTRDAQISQFMNVGKIPKNNVGKVIDDLQASTDNLNKATARGTGKLPVGNVSNVTDNRVNTNTNTNTNTRTVTTENISNRLYDQSQFKKIDGRFFNSKKPLSERDFGDTTNYTPKATGIVNMSSPASLPTFGQPETRYVNVTDREAFENRPTQPTFMPTRITEPRAGARGYSKNHSFIEEQGYKLSDYTNSKTRPLTTAEKQQLELERRSKLTSGKFGGAWNKYFKVKDRVGQFMNEYDDTPTVSPMSGKYGRVYSADTSDRYHNFISEAKGTDRNQTYVKKRSKLGARLFGYQHYEKDVQTGEMKRVGSYGGRLKADKDDKQTRLAVEKLSANKETDSLYAYKPRPQDYIGRADEYKEALTKRPNVSNHVGTVNDLLDPQGKAKVTLGRNNLESVSGDDAVFKAQQGNLRNRLFGERYYTVGKNDRGDLYEHTVARRGGLVSRLTGNQNQMRVRDEGDVSLGGRVRGTVSSVKNTVSKYTPQAVKDVGGAISGKANNLWGNAMLMGSSISNSMANNKLVKGASNALGAVKGSKTVQRIANSKPMQFVTSKTKSAFSLAGASKAGKAVKGAGGLALKGVQGAGKVAGGALKGAGGLAMGALRFAPLAMIGASLGSTMYNGIKEKGGGDFKEGLKMFQEESKSIDFSGMWSNMVNGAKEILPIVGGIFKNVFQNLARDLPNILSNAWEGIKAGASIAWNWITTDGKSIFSGFASSLWELVGSAWEWISTDGLTMFSNIVGWVLTDGVPLLIQGLMGIGSWLITEGVPFVLKALWDITKWIASDFIPAVLRGFVGMIANIGTVIWDGITGAFNNVFTWVGEKWNGLFGKKQTIEIDVVENKVSNTGVTTSPTTTAPKTSPKPTSLDLANPMRPSYGVHHSGLWMSENEHPAIIRKDETVLPPDKSKKLDEVLNTVSIGNKPAKNKDTEVKEVGDSINIEKVEIVVQAEKLSKSDAKAQALQVIEEIKRLNKRNNIKNFVY